MQKGPTRVLLIEDNPGEVKQISGMLKAARDAVFDLQHAADLLTGLERLKLEYFDVLLLDLALPDSNGLETVSRMIAAAPEVPIIVLTDEDVASAILETIRAGVRDCFVKARLQRGALIEAVLRQAARRRQLAGDPDGASLRQRPLEPPTDGNIRVLVVEDNLGDFALLQAMLFSVTTVSFEIIHVSKLSTALRKLRAGFDAVLLDLNLPDSQDLDTLRSVRACDPHVPIIVLTGLEDRQKAVEALANGVQDYLVKGQVDGHLLSRSILRSMKAAAKEQIAW